MDDSILTEVAEIFGGRIYDGYVAIVCPYHSDHTPSMMVYPDRAVCQACGTIRTPQELIKEKGTFWSTDVQDFKPVLPWIPEKSREETAITAFKTLLLTGTEGYLLDRGIDRAHILKYRLGIYKGWYTFPVFDSSGNMQRLILRVSPRLQDKFDMRYLCMGSPVMYAPDYDLIKEKGHIVIVFGTIDAASLCAHGIPAVTTTAGQQHFHAEWLEKYRVPIYVVPDVGEEREGRKLSYKLGWRGHFVPLPKDGLKDPNDYITAGRLNELKEIIYG